MSLCVASAVVALALAGHGFTLSWVHSVERTEWQEHWVVDAHAQLQLDSARVKGSGAGMEPPPDAVLREGWWVYRPRRPAQETVVLAVSGATVGGWTLCVDGGACHDIETALGGARRIDMIRLSAGPRCEPLADKLR